MSPVERFERVLKDLDRLATKARKAGKLGKSLDDKVQAERVRRVLEETRRTLRLQYHEFEDVAVGAT